MPDDSPIPAPSSSPWRSYADVDWERWEPRDRATLMFVIDGDQVADPDADDPVLAELDALRADVTALVHRIDAIERRLGPDAGES